MTAKKRVRMNFRLPQSLADKLTSEARRLGIPKSKLLRRWITEDSDLHLKKYNNQSRTKHRVIHFYLSEEQKKKIAANAESYNTNISNYLRILVSGKLSINRNVQHEDSLLSHREARRLWMSGHLEELAYKLRNQIEKQSPENQGLYAKVEIDMSKESNAIDAISLLEKNQHHPWSRINAKLLQTDIAISRNNLPEVKNLLDNIQNDRQLYENRDLLGSFHFHYGKYYTKIEDIPKAHEHYTASLEFYDQINHPLEIVRTYNYIAHMNKFEGKNNLIEAYFKRSEVILNKIDNDYEKGWHYSQLAAHKLAWGLPGNSKDLLEKGLNKIRRYKSSKQRYMNRSIKGRLLLLEGNYKEAHRVLTESIKEELKFRPFVGSTQIYIHFIESVHNYNDSILSLQNSTGSDTYQNVREYILHTARYLHGPNYKERELGRKNLVKMSLSGNYPQVREASRKTLAQKRLQSMPV